MDYYLTSESHKMQITRPFEIISQATEYDVRCSVKGGGHTGQAGAMVHGISKALLQFDSELKGTVLRKEKAYILGTQERSKERNLAVKKLEEVFNFLKDNSFLTQNCYNKKCISLMY